MRRGTGAWSGWAARRELGAAVELLDGAAELDAAGACVLPGFVDAHTHAVFAGSRANEYAARLGGVATPNPGLGRRHQRDRAATRAATLESSPRPTLRRLDSFLAHGTTTLEVKSGYGLTTADEAKMLDAAAAGHPARRRLTLLGRALHAARVRGPRRRVHRPRLRGDAARAARPRRLRRRLLRRGRLHRGQSRRVLEAGKRLGFGLKIHADELARSGGSLLAAELGCVSADHLVHAGPEEIAALRDAGVVAVLLPGTSFTLHQAYARAREMLDGGLRSPWLPTSTPAPATARTCSR